MSSVIKCNKPFKVNYLSDPLILYACVHVRGCVYVCVCMCVYICVYMCVYMCVYVCICVYVRVLCVHACACIYIYKADSILP